MRKYDDEFKQNAVKKILDGQAVASVSRELGVAEGVLHKWRKERVASSSAAEKELLAVKRRLREVEMENEILKRWLLSSGVEASQIRVH